MSEVKVNFDDMKKPQQQQYISTAGFWRNAYLKQFGIEPLKEKTKKVDGKDVGTGEFTGGWLNVVLDSEQGIFQGKYFALATKPEEVKFVGKVYDLKTGAELRDKTKEEQLQDDYKDFAYFLIQLGMALGNEFDNVRRIVTGVEPTTFSIMIDAFAKAFVKDDMIKARIDYKTIFNNNDKAKTSFLQFPKATGNNIVFTQYDPKEPKSSLSFTGYEKKKKADQELYPYQKPASGGTGSTPATNTAIDSFTPAPEGELF